MFKNRVLLIVGVLSLLLVTMAVSRPFSSASAPSLSGANDFYQRHPDWNRNPVASDYYQRHSTASIADLTGDFALRHSEWSLSIQSAGIPVTGSLEGSDYFQRHAESGIDRTTLYQNYPGAWVSRAAGVALTVDSSLADLDYFERHPELRTPAQNTELSDYFQRH